MVEDRRRSRAAHLRSQQEAAAREAAAKEAERTRIHNDLLALQQETELKAAVKKATNLAYKKALVAQILEAEMRLVDDDVAMSAREAQLNRQRVELAREVVAEVSLQTKRHG